MGRPEGKRVGGLPFSPSKQQFNYQKFDTGVSDNKVSKNLI